MSKEDPQSAQVSVKLYPPIAEKMSKKPFCDNVNYYVNLALSKMHNVPEEDVIKYARGVKK